MPQTKGKILVVDDEEALCEVLRIILTNEGYEVQTAHEGEKALTLFRQSPFDIVIQDIKMPGIDGITLLKRFKELNSEITVIIITAFSTFQTAVEAMRLGAYDYIKKPFDNNRDLKATINRAIQFKHLVRHFKTKGLELEAPLKMMIGTTPAMREIYDLMRRVALTDSTVLVQGESGTGKELVARALHYTSSRSSEPFITVNCGAFTETLLESELFGHIKGAFTTAVSDKKGLLEVANKGTFFLDEVSELSPQMQTNLLRVLEQREFKPVGSTQTKIVDVRFITATNTDLVERIKNGAFREDLYYRLNVISIHLPPLRERKEDIPLLAGDFLAKYSRMMKKTVTKFTPEALESLMNYDWPGNVRELENRIQRAVALTENELISPEDLTQKVRPSPLMARGPGIEAELFPQKGLALPDKIKDMEKKYIKQALETTDWQLNQAANLLNMKLRSLRYKIKKYKINKERLSNDKT